MAKPTTLDVLIAKRVADPDDLELARSYARELLSAGDPLGELATLQTSGKRRTTKSKARVAALEASLGLPVPIDGVRFGDVVWGAGSIRELAVVVTRWDTAVAKAFPDFLRALLGRPALRFLTRLELDITAANPRTCQRIVTAIASGPRRLALRTLSLRVANPRDAPTGTLDVAPLVRVAKHLASLCLYCKTVRLRHQSFRALRHWCHNDDLAP